MSARHDDRRMWNSDGWNGGPLRRSLFTVGDCTAAEFFAEDLPKFFFEETFWTNDCPERGWQMPSRTGSLGAVPTFLFAAKSWLCSQLSQSRSRQSWVHSWTVPDVFVCRWRTSSCPTSYVTNMSSHTGTRIVLNVGGERHEILRRTLLRMPQTRLGRLVQLLGDSDVDPESDSGVLDICDDVSSLEVGGRTLRITRPSAATKNVWNNPRMNSWHPGPLWWRVQPKGRWKNSHRILLRPTSAIVQRRYRVLPNWKAASCRRCVHLVFRRWPGLLECRAITVTIAEDTGGVDVVPDCLDYWKICGEET